MQVEQDFVPVFGGGRSDLASAGGTKSHPKCTAPDSFLKWPWQSFAKDVGVRVEIETQELQAFVTSASTKRLDIRVRRLTLDPFRVLSPKLRTFATRPYLDK